MKRNGIIDIYRFVGSMMIVTHHLYCIGDFERGQYMGYGGWIFNEFFFILSGALMMKHFDNKSENSIGEKINQASNYAWSKYLRILPYVCIISVINCVLVNLKYIICVDIKSFIYSFNIIPLEWSLLHAIIPTSLTNTGALWFVSALIIMTPLVASLCQIKDKRIVIIIAFYISVFIFPLTSSTDFPYSLIKALGGLMMGVLAYFGAKKLYDKFGKKYEFLFFLIEQLSMWTAIYIAIRNYDLWRLQTCLFFGAIMVLMSGCSYSTHLFQNDFTSLLGKLSMATYVCHEASIKLLAFHFKDLRTESRVLMYYVSMLVISLICYYLVNELSRRLVRHGQNNR